MFICCRLLSEIRVYRCYRRSAIPHALRIIFARRNQPLFSECTSISARAPISAPKIHAARGARRAGLYRTDATLYIRGAVWPHSALRRAVISAPSSLAKSFSPSTSLLLFPYYGPGAFFLADAAAQRGASYPRVSQFFFQLVRLCSSRSTHPR